MRSYTLDELCLEGSRRHLAEEVRNRSLHVEGTADLVGERVAGDRVGHLLAHVDRIRVREEFGVDDVTVVRGDVTDPTDVVRTVRETGTNRIVHLAALLTTTARENPRAAIDVMGTNNVFETARTLDEQVERVAWTSSAAVFAPPANYADDWVAEDDLGYEPEYDLEAGFREYINTLRNDAGLEPV